MEQARMSALQDCLTISADGLCRLNRRVYTDPEIFELEIATIWEKGWLFLAHESQIPRANDFFTTHIGRQPVVIMRNGAGELGAFINACTHRGATICRTRRGNSKLHPCPYHGWTFNSSGELIAIKNEALGGYPSTFDKRNLGLRRIPHFANYRGFLFGSLDANSPTLQQHLGSVTVFLDLLVDQAASGWEVIKGSSSYVFNGNWKLQAENGVDMYHATTVHWNYAATQRHRAESKSKGEKVRAMQLQHDPQKQEGGYFDLGHGHVVVWRDWSNPEDRFNFSQQTTIAQRIGEIRAKWAVRRLRNMLIYPNLLVMDQMSSQLRIIRPLAVDRTLITSYAIAPVGELPDERRRRLRSYEDFFNASGLATPDDLAEFNAVQEGAHGRTSPHTDLSRGAANVVHGPNQFAQELEIEPVTSGSWIEDEGLFVGKYRNWLERVSGAVVEIKDAG